MSLFALLAGAFLQADAGAPAFDVVPTGDAIAFFRHICVETLPEPRAFAAALAAEPTIWTPFQKSDRGTPVIGHFWRSSQGELHYQNLPGMPFETNPGCHFTFRIEPAFGHVQAAQQLTQALGLDSGRSTGNARAPQTRWEAILQSGLRVRIFLSSAVDLGGVPAARLSISAYVDQRPRRQR